MANKDFIIKKGVIVTDDIQINSSGDIIKLDISAWGSNSEQKIIINSFNSTIGDHLLVKAAGNGTTQHGAIVIADNVFSYGRTTSGGQVDASLTSPLPNATSFTVDWQGNANFAGSITSDDSIYAADTNLSTSPSFAFKGHTDTGIGVQADGSNDRLNLIVDGVTRAYANISGFFSQGNLYSANGGQFRNFAGTWKATTGVTGNGFEFINTVDGTAMTLSADGDMIVYGNLEVRGTQTILNTATLSVDDLNITIADGAANATAANGAGLTVDGANATITYTSAQDEWNFNKNVVIGGKDTTSSFPLMVRSNSVHKGIHIEENSGGESWQMGVNATGDLNFYNSGSGTASITFEDSGDVGIGVSAPTAKLDVSSSTAEAVVARFTGTYTANGDVALSEWQRNGGAVKANFAYADSTTDMEFGTTTSHGLSIKTGNTRRLTINSSGNATFTGTVTADTHFTSSDSNATLSSSGSGGYVYLRPNGNGTATGETRIDTSGQLNVNSTSTSHGLEISQSTNTGYAPASILLKATQSTARGGGIYSYNTQSDNGWYSGSLYNNTNLWAVTFLNGTSFNSAIAQTTNAIFTVDGPNGRVGIGTTSPSRKVAIFDSVDGYNLELSQTSAYNSGLQSGIVFTGKYNTGTNVTHLASIRGGKENTTNWDYGGNLRFYTRINGGADTERMRIDSLGNIGIGETNIDAKLHLTTASAGLINQKFESATSAAWRLGIPASQTYFAFDNANDNLSSPKVVIDSTGNVGIGTTSPDQALEVAGHIRIDNGASFSSYEIYRDNIRYGKVGNGSNQFTIQADNNKNINLFDTSGVGLTVKNGGNVGIGTSVPDHILELSKDMSTSPTSVIFLRQTGTNQTGGGGAIRFDTSASNDDHTLYYASVEGIRSTSTNGSNELHFKTTKSGVNNNAPSTKMVVDEDGNVGIGTINPTHNLHVKSTGNTEIDVERASGAKINLQAQSAAGYVGTDSNHVFGLKSNSTVRLKIATSGAISFNDAYTFPTTDGSANQVLQTDGSGNLTFATESGGVSISNNVNNRVLTGDGTNANAEANLTFDGSTLGVTGTINSTGLTVSTSSSIPTFDIVTTHPSGIPILNLKGAASAQVRYQDENGNNQSRIDFNDAGAFSFIDATDGSSHLVINSSGNATLSGNLYLSGSSTNYLSMHAGDMLKHNTGNGYIEFGPANTGHAHIQTDRSNFYFNVGLQVNTGIIASYDEDLVLQRARSTAYELTLKTTGLELDQGTMHLKTGLYSANNTDVKLRQYYLSTGDAGGSFLLGKIENSANADGGVEGIVRFAHDYGSSTNNCAIHFHFAQRSGTARGTWWYEHDDQEGTGDRVHVRLIDDGAGNMYVWATCVDYAKTYIETTWRQCTSVSDSGTLTAGTLTTGTTLFDTANDPTSEMHIGNLYAHGFANFGGNCTFNGTSNQMLGLSVLGDVLFDGINTGGISFDRSDDAFEFSDNARAKFGNGSDLQIYHDATDSYIQNSTGTLYINNLSNDKDIFIQSDDGSGGLTTYLFADGSEGSLKLFHYGSKKLETTSTGVTVTGLLSATTKSFDIEHPSKKGDWRLRYGSLEGPENGVYVRGKSKEKVILLPDYWVDLVHEDSITVQLTAIGGGQNLYVEDIKNNKVFVNGENYFYYIQAERKDVDKLEVEYERT